jgi:hypothetical protein
VLRFYRNEYRGRVGRIFVESVFGVEKWAGVLWGVFLLVLAFFTRPVQEAVLNVWQGLPFWVVPAFVIASAVFLFGRGLLKENQRRIQKAERDNERLQASITTDEERRALKDLLGIAHEKGDEVYELRENDSVEWRERRIRQWVNDIHALIEAALDKSAAKQFLSNDGYDFGRHIDSVTEHRQSRDILYVPARQWSIRELSRRIDRERLNIRPDFDFEAHARRFRESPAEPVDPAVELEQIKAEKEKLKMHNEELAAERDAFELKSREFKDERDGQVRGRCWELYRDLSKFLKGQKQQDPDETMHQYRDQFKGRFERVRQDLERLEWWNPREDLRAKLENPETPDDLWILADYLADISAENSP